MSASFAYYLSHPSCQDLLKEELRSVAPGLRLAFSQPGLVSFKSELTFSNPSEIPSSALALGSGLSLGMVRDLDLLVGLLERNLPSECYLRIRPFPKDESHEEMDPTLGDPKAALLDRIGKGLKSKMVHPFPEGQATLPVSTFDLFFPSELGQPGNFLLGRARLEPGTHETEQGRVLVPLPSSAPSRAYRKIEEVIRHFSLPLLAGQTALEVGAAPGGAVYSMLKRGIHVIAVDPAELSPAVFELAEAQGLRCIHHQRPVLALSRNDISYPVDWLLCDMNLAPQVVVSHIGKVLSYVRGSLRGAILTLKLNDPKAARELPRLKELLTSFGLGSPRFCHLPSHRREVAAVLLRP